MEALPELAEREDSLVQGLVSGVAVFRWLAWAWVATMLVLSRRELTDPQARGWIAYLLAAAALAVTAGITVLLRTAPDRLLTLPVVATEVAVGCALGIGDQLAFNGVSHPQMLGSIWPLAGIITAGIAYAGRGGLLAGVTVGLGHLIGDTTSDSFTWDRAQVISPLSTLVLFTLAGGIAGLVTVKLREAERRISRAQAREEIARTLHDGVLQTLAVVRRRATDPDVVRLATEQERELREYLFGSPSTVSGGGEVGTRLRSAAARFEDHYGARARVVLAPDVPALPPAIADALVGAVNEALTNAGKHGGARTVTVFAEPVDGAVFCSIKDDGSGFDPAQVDEGVGLSRSIRGRIVEVGGRVEIDGRPGRGAEVRCWVPV
ncbi:MAG TPA: ATP-binding protein [Acidimicrobiales bacterium]|nr:ATP-binding protein [Acidimicrobiales bacterium]